MSRRTLFIISIIVTAVLMAALAFFIFGKELGLKKEEKAKEQLIKLELFQAVPTDAVALGYFSDIKEFRDIFFSENTVFNNYIDKKSTIFRFIERIYKEKLSKSISPIVSLHYSAKNDLSFLYTINLAGGEEDFNKISKVINKDLFTKRSFFGVLIYDSAELSYTYYKDFLICSSSKILLESSIRHLANSTSILDNSEFKMVAQNHLHYRNLLIYNNLQTGKLFSGILSRGMLKYFDFIMNFSSWVAIEAKPEKRGDLNLVGNICNYKGVGNYSSIFKDVEPGVLMAPNILPYNTIVMVSITTNDFEKYLLNKQKYLSYYKKLDSVDYTSKVSLFLKERKREIVVALIPVGDKNEWITLVRSLKKVSGKNRLPKGTLGALFGDIFSQEIGNGSYVIDKWDVTGSMEAINIIIKSNSSDSTFNTYLKDRKLSNNIKSNGAIITSVVNIVPKYDSIPFIFNKRVIDLINGKRVVGIDNESVSVQIFPDSQETGISLTLISRK